MAFLNLRLAPGLGVCKVLRELQLGRFLCRFICSAACSVGCLYLMPSETCDRLDQEL